MDLAVLMDGVVHTLTGVSESTTCKEVVYTLAHAKGRTGRFVLQLILQQQEKPLLPSDRPLVMLRNLKERAKHAVFALRSADGAEEMAASCGESTKKKAAPPRMKVSGLQSSQSADQLAPLSNNSTQTGCSTSVVSSDSYVFKTSASSSSMNFSKPRPPPPDYNTFMAQRFNSLTRNKMARNSDSKRNNIVTTKTSLDDMNESELLALIDQQREIIHQQELRLVKDESMCSGEELELIQLERQLENLEIILKPLRASNFERQYNDEYNKALRLQMAINAKKADIATLQEKIISLTEEEDLLTKELFNNMTLMDCAALESSSVLTKKQFI